ncbi:uncharacterized protein LOC143714696 [Siphateles boraxobius]|uniref:uncharacterized protein LOC143714696 n=1 Tax=Siphateles boraxobius TaxID=180520 RepID=UPI004062A51B
MAEYIFYYLQTLLTPLLALTVILCILRYCCKFCRKVSDTDLDLDLSDSDHVYVIPNPIHTREERDETDSHGDSEYTPPPYELVCPPPTYAEASFKVNISDVRVAPDSEMDVPPPPYSPPLNMPSQSSSHQQ